MLSQHLSGNVGAIDLYTARNSIMIRYVLRCDEEHRFEAWFRSKADYERTLVSGETTCPLCELTAIESVAATSSVNLVNRTHRSVN